MYGSSRLNFGTRALWDCWFSAGGYELLVDLLYENEYISIGTVVIGWVSHRESGLPMYFNSNGFVLNFIFQQLFHNCFFVFS